MAEQAVTLQQGIWIDRRRLAEAGLQDPFEITIQPGEIRIRSGQVGQPEQHRTGMGCFWVPGG